MREVFVSAFGESLFAVSPVPVLLRVLAAVLLGGIVAWIHARATGTHRENALQMQATLVLLAGLIAMVTQVIGDNVARAFSLVGALSIVRFRTVVRDTRDTAFVIFAVAVGMAVGAQAPWVALVGVAVLGATALFLSRGSKTNAAAAGLRYRLQIRAAADVSLEKLCGEIFDRHLESRQLEALRTAKQGAFLDHSLTAVFRADAYPEELVRELNRTEGLQEVKILRPGAEEESPL